MIYSRLLLLITFILNLGACASIDEHSNRHYPEHIATPSSILVLPPLNHSHDERASYAYLSTVSKPLAAAGYYVIPVAVADAYFKANGLFNPGDMHAVNAPKYQEILGADAVLYIRVNEYGQIYRIFSSETVVSAHATLVHSATEEIIWQGDTYVSVDSDQDDSITNTLINAVITQIAKANSNHALKLSRRANRELLNGRNGLPYGPLHPCFSQAC